MSETGSTIEREELQAKMARGDDFRLVEILPPPMYRSGHLPGASYIPPVQVRELAAKRLPDRSADIVLYCAGPGCHTAPMAARDLAALGYTRVRVYHGGKADWTAAGLPLER